MHDNKIKNLTVILLSVIIVTLVGIQVSAVDNRIPQKPLAAHSKTTVTKVSQPIAKTNNTIQKPIGKSLKSGTVANANSNNQQSVQKQSPYLSPLIRQNLSSSSVAKLNSSTDNAGIDALREPNFGPYMRELQRKIKMNWDPPKGNESKKVVASFKIAKNGALSDLYIKTSGNKLADEAALNAIKATKFNPLPKDYQKDYIDIQFTFDYNVFSAEKR